MEKHRAPSQYDPCLTNKNEWPPDPLFVQTSKNLLTMYSGSLMQVNNKAGQKSKLTSNLNKVYVMRPDRVGEGVFCSIGLEGRGV